MIELTSPPPGEISPAVPAAPVRAIVAPTPVDEPPLLDVAAWLRGAPPWLLSAIVHMSALIALGLLFFQPKIDDDLLLDAGYSDDVRIPLEDDLDLAQSNLDEVKIDEQVVTDHSLPQVDEPFASPDV